MFPLKKQTIAVGMFALVCICGTGRGELVVRFDPPQRTVGLGETFSIDILADISDPLLGWGLDLSFDPSILAQLGTPGIGPQWISAFAPDGDGLAALAFPESVSGMNILLASVTFSAAALGETDLMLSTTPGDFTEGFALDPTGFAEPGFHSAHVVVVPEPATGFLAVIALSSIGLATRCGSGLRSLRRALGR